MLATIMAHLGASTNASYGGNGDGTGSTSEIQQRAVPILHDFLGGKIEDVPVLFVPKTADVSLSDASSSALASIGASSSAGRGLFSSSDLGSEPQVGDYLEGVPFFSPRNEFENINKIAGIKRSNPDSAFTGSNRNQNSYTMKILQNGAGGDRPSSNDNGTVDSMHPPRRASSSFTQYSHDTRINAHFSKYKGPPVLYRPVGNKFMPHAHQVARFGEFNLAPSTISQSGADEGSRTGMKSPGIFGCIDDLDGNGKHSSHMLLSCNRQKYGTEVMGHKSSDPPSQQRSDSNNRQMTIFYNGQAHVFDDVHPNKADVIMALAGSNGGSWSTALPPKSSVRPDVQSYTTSTNNGEIETGICSDHELAREYRGKSFLTMNMISSQAVGNHPISTRAGDHSRGTPAKETREPVRATGPSNEGCSSIQQSS